MKIKIDFRDLLTVLEEKCREAYAQGVREANEPSQRIADLEKDNLMWRQMVDAERQKVADLQAAADAKNADLVRLIHAMPEDLKLVKRGVGTSLRTFAWSCFMQADGGDEDSDNYRSTPEMAIQFWLQTNKGENDLPGKV